MIVILLSLITFIIIKKESKNIFLVDSILVPIMLLFYLSLGIYVLLSSNNIINIFKGPMKEEWTL